MKNMLSTITFIAELATVMAFSITAAFWVKKQAETEHEKIRKILEKISEKANQQDKLFEAVVKKINIQEKQFQELILHLNEIDLSLAKISTDYVQHKINKPLF
jgi:hypothetical protein